MSELRGNKLNKFGLIGTAIYLLLLVGLILLLASSGGLDIKAPLKLNELGDFLAGAFGPLAIFWLVLGFFQQGRELQNSIETLKLQAKELARSVEQQREMVSVTKDGLEHERLLMSLEISQREKTIRPKFLIRFGAVLYNSQQIFSYSLSVRNTGASVTDVTAKLWTDPTTHILVKNIDFFPTDEKMLHEFYDGFISPEALVLHITYTNEDAVTCEDTFKIVTNTKSSDPYLIEKVQSGNLNDAFLK